MTGASEGSENIVTRKSSNPYTAAGEASRNSYRMSVSCTGPEAVTSKPERVRQSMKRELDELTARAEYRDYIQALKTRRVVSLRLPAYTSCIARRLREVAQCAPEDTHIKLKVHNVNEPFNQPKLRLELTAVTGGSVTVLSQYERRAPERFTHESLHTARGFTYSLDNSIEAIAPWVVLELPTIKYKGHDSLVKYVHEHRQIMKTDEVFLREPGLYLFIPHNESD